MPKSMLDSEAHSTVTIISSSTRPLKPLLETAIQHEALMRLRMASAVPSSASAGSLKAPAPALHCVPAASAAGGQR